MWISIIILGLLLIYISAMCRAAGRPMPGQHTNKTIAKELQHDQTNHQTDLAGNHRGISMDADPNLAQKPRHNLAPLDSVAAYAYQALDRATKQKGEK